eukprot:7378592-Prymnesium_polylepis.2
MWVEKVSARGSPLPQVTAAAGDRSELSEVDAAACLLEWARLEWGLISPRRAPDGRQPSSSECAHARRARIYPTEAVTARR